MRSSRDDSLNRAEFNILWEEAQKGDIKDMVIFCCAGHLGMRASEIAKMEKTWIDLDRKMIQIPRSVAKSNAGQRTIPYSSMNPRVEKVLNRFFKYHDKMGLTRQAVWHRVKNMSDRANLADCYPHALRATAAFQLASAGINAQGLRQIMGWSKLEVAESYIRQAGRAAEQQLKKIGDDLW